MPPGFCRALNRRPGGINFGAGQQPSPRCASRCAKTVQGAMPREKDFQQTLCADIDGFSQPVCISGWRSAGTRPFRALCPASPCTPQCAALPTTARRWSNCAATSPARLAGRAGPEAQPLARHKQSTGLFVSGPGLSASAHGVSVVIDALECLHAVSHPFAPVSQPVGAQRKQIHRPRRKKYTPAGMARWVGRQFALAQLQQRQPHSGQFEGRSNPLEDTHTVIADPQV